MRDKYMAFYSARPFWAVDDIDFSKPDVLPKFTDLMQEIVFSHEEEAYKLLVCRDGKILLRVRALEEVTPPTDHPDIEPYVTWWSRYLAYLNCLYLLLDSCVLEVAHIAWLELSELTRKDVIRAELEGTEIIGENIATESYAGHYQMGNFLGVQGTSIQGDVRLILRKLLPLQVFQLLVTKASAAFSQPSLVSNLSAAAKALSEFKAGNFHLALVISWFVTESELSAMWKAHLEQANTKHEDGSVRINAERMQTLTEGRDFPISVVSNHLELVGLLPTDRFRTVDRVRGYRNKIIHQHPGFVCTSAHAREAIDLALDLTLANQSLSVRPNYSYGVQGP